MTKPDWNKIPEGYDFKRKNLGPATRIAGLAIFLLIAGFILILGIIYFMVSIWVVKLGASWAGFKSLEGHTVVLTAGIITAATLISSAMQKY